MEKKEMKKLKIGDVLYREDRFGINRVVIDRLTPKQAVAGHNRRFKIEYVGDTVIEIGGGCWHPETEGLKSRWERVRAYRQAINLKVPFSSMTIEQLQKYIDFVNSLTITTP